MTESYSMTTAALEHVQAVAFDLDGTLCDSVPDLAAAAQAMCAHLGLPVLANPNGWKLCRRRYQQAGLSRHY